MSTIINSGSTKGLIITPTYVINHSFPNENVDQKLLRNAIVISQDIVLKPLIGGTLFYTLLNKIQAQTLTGEYKFIVDNFITPCLLYNTLYEYMPFSQNKFRNKGISKQTSPDSENLDMAETLRLENRLIKISQSYGQELVVYLKAHIQDFPEYLQFQNDQIRPAINDTFSGIHIPGVNRGPSDIMFTNPNTPN